MASIPHGPHAGRQSPTDPTCGTAHSAALPALTGDPYADGNLLIRLGVRQGAIAAAGYCAEATGRPELVSEVDALFPDPLSAEGEQ
jgi:hypothetical protein